MAVKRTSKSERSAELDRLIDVAGIVWDGQWYVHTEEDRLGPFDTYEDAVLASARAARDAAD